MPNNQTDKENPQLASIKPGVDENNSSLESENFVFKSLNVYASGETYYQNTRNYRAVYELEDIEELYAELALYNKKFAEEDWQLKIEWIIERETPEGNYERLVGWEEDHQVSKEDNIARLVVDLTQERDFNLSGGTYRLRVRVDGSSQRVYFFINDISETAPYFKLTDLSLKLDDEKKLSKVGIADVGRAHLEATCENRQSQEDWYLEFEIHIYDEAGRLIESLYLVRHIVAGHFGEGFSIDLPLDEMIDEWDKGSYTINLVSSGQTIALVPLEVAAESQEGELEYRKIAETQKLAGVSEEAVKEENGDKTATLEEALAKLHRLIGLENIKDEIDNFVNYAQFQKLREKKGLEATQKIVLHSVFTGNPGTGKTTVAHLLGDIYRHLGLLSTGELVEVSRNELIAEYVGQTAPKTKKMIEKARGGILFIDEAYGLHRGENSEDFGSEAIEIIMKEMSDGPGDIAIIVAGYPEEMEDFLLSNPGLESRFARHYRFADYLPDELMDIAELMAKDRGLSMSQEARGYLKEEVVEAYRSRDKNFGNARFIESVISEANINLGSRIIKQDKPDQLSEEDLSTLTRDDIEQVFISRQKVKKLDLDVDEKLLAEALSSLNELIGLSTIKQEVHDHIKLIEYYERTDRDILNQASLHSVFLGNPGTGKTTVARLLSRIYKALGLLEGGHLVEVSREDLVAGHVGQTAIKTRKVIDKAIGGVLFIDEAYSLTRGSDNDFGAEAIATIVKQMEDRRGEFILIVAGYSQEMEEFLRSNPGLKSRFNKTYHFDDFSVEELMEIANLMFAERELMLNHSAREKLQLHLESLYSKKDRYFGNARTVRNIVEEATRHQHLRMADASDSQETVNGNLVIAADLELES